MKYISLALDFVACRSTYFRHVIKWYILNYEFLQVYCSHTCTLYLLHTLTSAYSHTRILSHPNTLTHWILSHLHSAYSHTSILSLTHCILWPQHTLTLVYSHMLYALNPRIFSLPHTLPPVYSPYLILSYLHTLTPTYSHTCITSLPPTLTTA